jgi:general stress protein CsbA
MNKDQAINILLKHAKGYNNKEYVVDVQKLTAAVLCMDTHLQKNKQDAKIQITGMQMDSKKGA